MLFNTPKIHICSLRSQQTKISGKFEVSRKMPMFGFLKGKADDHHFEVTAQVHVSVLFSPIFD